MAQVRQLVVRPEYAEYLVNTWTLQNACVAFHTRRNTSFRSQWISRRGVAATVFGFSEYVNGYQRLSWVRPELPSDDLDSCAVGESGVVISFPANNVYHALFHAVPAWRALGRASGQLIPLVGEHAGRWIGRGGAWRAHAWEFVARALTTRAPDALFSDLKRLLTARCTCFQHVVGNTEAFEPRAPGSRGVLQAFCRAALRNSARFVSGAAALPRPHRLYVARRGARSLHNEEAVAAVLREHAVHRVQLEALSLSDQMHLVARARLLITPHGQALGYMPFLTLVDGGSAGTVVEFALPHTALTWRSRLMYAKWALSLRLAYVSIRTAHWAGCPLREKVALACPLVVRLKEVRAAILAATEERRPFEPRWCDEGEIRLCK